MKKIIFISNIIAPYRVPFFNNLSENNNIALNVLYLAENEKNRNWNIEKNELKYAYNVLPGFHIPHIFKTGTVHINYNYRYFLDMASPDIIVLGTDLMSSTISLGIILYAKKRGITLIRYEGQHCYNNSIGKIKSIIYKNFYKMFDGFFVYSKLTRKYLIEKHNISDKKIKIGYNVGDLDCFFKTNYIQNNNKIRILFCGSLDDRKNILPLLSILKTDFDNKKFVFTIIGDGPYFNKVKLISEKFNNIKVLVKGNIYNENLIQEYSISDIFILPSKFDPASIVITEALASGLFTIGSKFDGSAVNFIEDKINGILVDPNDLDSIKAALEFSLIYVKSNSYNRLLIKEKMKKNSIKNYVNNFTSWDLIK